MDATKRLAEVKAALLKLVEEHEDPCALEGRGDITAFLETLRDFAHSIDKPSLDVGR